MCNCNTPMHFSLNVSYCFNLSPIVVQIKHINWSSMPAIYAQISISNVACDLSSSVWRRPANKLSHIQQWNQNCSRTLWLIRDKCQLQWCTHVSHSTNFSIVVFVRLRFYLTHFQCFLFASLLVLHEYKTNKQSKTKLYPIRHKTNQWWLEMHWSMLSLIKSNPQNKIKTKIKDAILGLFSFIFLVSCLVWFGSFLSETNTNKINNHNSNNNKNLRLSCNYTSDRRQT